MDDSRIQNQLLSPTSEGDVPLQSSPQKKGVTYQGQGETPCDPNQGSPGDFNNNSIEPSLRKAQTGNNFRKSLNKKFSVILQEKIIEGINDGSIAPGNGIGQNESSLNAAAGLMLSKG